MGLIATLGQLVKIYTVLYGAWATFKVLKGGTSGTYDAALGERMLRFWSVLSGIQTYDMYLEWAVSFWCPFYFELKLAALVWLAYPGSDASNWLFQKMLHPAMAVASYHLQRDIIPRLASAALYGARRLQAQSVAPMVGAVRRDELKMWDRSVRGQLACVQIELERRRSQGLHMAVQRLPDASAAALLAGGKATRAQLMRELLQPAAAASANGGICGSYKRGQSTVPAPARPGVGRSSSARRASSAARVRFSGAVAGVGGMSIPPCPSYSVPVPVSDVEDDDDGAALGGPVGGASSPGSPGATPGMKQLPLGLGLVGGMEHVSMRRRGGRMSGVERESPSGDNDD